MSFFENTRKPVGFGGKIMVAMMNLGHSAVARWGLQFLNAAPDAKVLDCGCGGGANIRRLLKKCPQGIVKGIDYSPVSVEKSKKVNDAATITPAVKPASERCTRSSSDRFRKNTQADPSVVPKKGIMIPRKVSICLTAFALQYYLFRLNPASSRYSGCSFKYGSLSPQMV